MGRLIKDIQSKEQKAFQLLKKGLEEAMNSCQRPGWIARLLKAAMAAKKGGIDIGGASGSHIEGLSLFAVCALQAEEAAGAGIKALLEAGFQETLSVESGNRALTVAACNENISAMEALLAGSSPDDLGRALCGAASHGYQASVVWLLGHGADVLWLDPKTGDWPLYLALLDEQEELLEILGTDEAWLLKTKEGESALHAAALWPDGIEACRLALEKGCSLDKKTRAGKTVLDVAEEGLNHQVAAFLKTQIEKRQLGNALGKAQGRKAPSRM